MAESPTTPVATAVAPTMPARWVPLLYFGFAHACLAVAALALALDARGLVGFFYHPKMLAVVHLVTLGFISASILGAVYVVGPLAFRMPLPARKGDYFAFAGFAIGTTGMVSHFWLDLPAGMAWAAGLVGLSMSHVAARGLAGLRRAPVPPEPRFAMALALANVLAAAGLGVVAAANKVVPFAPWSQLDLVFAHAHLAALGWGAMMVVGAGYRMLPIILPSAMPGGPWAYAAPIALECGIVGVVWALLTESPQLGACAAVVVVGLLGFLSRVVWMLRHRRPGPTELPRPDWGVAHALVSLLYLLLATALGFFLALAERSETTLRLASVYGVFGLLGFLSQIIVGVEGRILPLFAWLWGFADRAYTTSPPSLHRAPARPVQGLVFALWTLAVPGLALGLATERVAVVSTAAGALLVATIAGAAHAGLVLRRLWRR